MLTVRGRACGLLNSLVLVGNNFQAMDTLHALVSKYNSVSIIIIELQNFNDTDLVFLLIFFNLQSFRFGQSSLCFDVEVLIQFDSKIYEVSKAEIVFFNLTLTLSTASTEDVHVDLLIYNVSGYGEYCIHQ